MVAFLPLDLFFKLALVGGVTRYYMGVIKMSGFSSDPQISDNPGDPPYCFKKYMNFESLPLRHHKTKRHCEGYKAAIKQECIMFLDLVTRHPSNSGDK